MPEKFDFSKTEGREKPEWKRLPITVRIGNEKKNVWVSYIVEAVESEGYCKFCNKEGKIGLSESVKEAKVESNNPLEIEQATRKIKELVKIIENKMFVCRDCFGEDFIKQRKKLYIKALREAQEELGIEVNEEDQEKEINKYKEVE